jgi:exopolysaccharide production protein ExoY
MVSVSEFAANPIPDKHSESAVNRHPVILRDRETLDRSSADGVAQQNRAIVAPNGSAQITSIRPGAYSELVPVPVGGWSKRAFDLLIASTSLVLMLPLMVTIAAVILITMGRPVLFVQKRAGFNRKVFGCFKFRTMVADADERLARYLQHSPEAARSWAETQKLKDDPRVTRFGHILRKSSLDELPQLLNVLRGEMSCIGPRPVPLSELHARYGAAANDYARAKPGVTGMWQVNGRSSTTYSRRVACDRVYVRRWSMLLDMNILFRTVPALLKTDQTS